MAITRSVKQQYEHYVAVKSGVLDETNCLMHTAVLNENADKVVRGSVISLNAAGEFVLGLPEGSGNLYPMPCFAKKNAFDPDVMTGAVGSATGEVIASSTVGKKMSAYVATGAFEIESSEFDKDATYAINAALVCADGDKLGKVTPGGENAVYGAKAVVGIVSALPFRSKASLNVNATAVNRICFWSVFFPPKRG